MPRRFRAPYSVTSQCASARRTDTAVPGSKTGTIRDTVPPSAVLGKAMIERPPLLRAVDGYDILESADAIGIVGVFNRMKFDQRVPVNKVIEPLCPPTKAGHDL